MTPLVAQAVELLANSGFADPSLYKWFDLGATVPPGAKLTAALTLPFEYCAAAIAVGEDKEVSPMLLRQVDPKTVEVEYGADSSGMGKFRVFVDGDTVHVMAVDAPKFSSDEEEREVGLDMITVCCYLCDIPTGVSAHTPTGNRSNAKRIRNGKKPLFTWTTVTIQPKRLANVNTLGGTHASPRLHDRRGHWRTCKTGKRVWVRDCKVGSAVNGIGFHDYEVRP